jgi:hypothetical protein
MRITSITIVTGIALAAACGSGGNNGTDAGPTGVQDPLGKVGGLVFDGATWNPLAGAKVDVISAGTTLSATTGADGSFTVAGVPAGTIIVRISDSGHLTATLTAELPAVAGDVVVANPSLTIDPIGLVASTGTFQVKLIEQDGTAAASIPVTAQTKNAQYLDYATGTPVGVGATTFSATSGADGIVTFTGLPDYPGLGVAVDDTLKVSIAPIAVPGTGYTFLGLTVPFQVEHLGTAIPTITLAGPQTSLAVYTSNDRYFYSPTYAVTELDPIQPTDNVVIVFNQAIDPGASRVQLYLENGTQLAGFQPTLVTVGNQLTILPTPLYHYGLKFYLLVHVASLTASSSTVASEYDSFVPLFIAPQPGTLPSVVPTSIQTITNPNGTISVLFALSEPIGIGQGHVGGYDCIASYEANLDNGNPALYVGEYAALSWPPCISQVTNPPGMNVTVLRPIETGPVTTGFASQFSVDFNNTNLAPNGNSYACAPSDPPGSCIGPARGNVLHLRFATTPAGTTIRRVTGEPVSESSALTFTIAQ